MSESPSPYPPNTFRAFLTAGLIVGTCDIVAAHVPYFLNGGKSPLRVLHFVASGAFGKAAFAGDLGMAAWGLLFHYVIAFSFAGLFFAAYPHVAVLAKHRLATALGYGLFVWSLMNLAVLPLSNIPKGPFSPATAALNAGILIVCIGLPLSLLAHRHYTTRAST
ncbi:MAG: hypothetical protein NTV51_23320 [Verrucomicrobia bacterium]|nr:hypothetical protein [Verrucomicrobiota bacterium]